MEENALARSFVDPTLFFRFMHVKEDDIPDEVIGLINSADESDAKRLEQAYDAQFAKEPYTLFHEAYHFWQGIRLPFLHRYAVITFGDVFHAFGALSKDRKDYKTWGCYLPSLSRLEKEAYVWGHPVDGKAVTFAYSKELPKNQGVEPILRITPLDLLESAASLAEFEVFGQKSKTYDSRDYRKWKNSRPSYTSCFKYVSTSLGSEALALRAFIPLVNAAFETSEPARAFMVLLAVLCREVSYSEKRSFLFGAELSCWRAIFHGYLNNVRFDEVTDNDWGDVLTDKFFRIHLGDWVGASFGYIDGLKLEHPSLGVLSRLWQDAPKEIDLAIDHPGALSKKEIDQVIKMLIPPVTVVKFHIGNGQGRTFLWGHKDYLSGVLGENGKFPLLDIFVIFSAISRASYAHYQEGQRLCHHSACCHYEENFCTLYPAFPRGEYGGCGFDERIKYLIQLSSTKEDSEQEAAPCPKNKLSFLGQMRKTLLSFLRRMMTPFWGR